MIKKMMIAGLLIWGGSLWAVAQTRMTIAQLFERIEENSKSLRTSKSGVEAASIGIESAKSKKLPDLDASLSFSYIGNALMTDRDFSNAQGLKSPTSAIISPSRHSRWFMLVAPSTQASASPNWASSRQRWA